MSCFGDLNLKDGIPSSTAMPNYKILQLLSLDRIESNFLTTRYTQRKNTVNLGEQNYVCQINMGKRIWYTYKQTKTLVS
jgi:hypothetical protein